MEKKALRALCEASEKLMELKEQTDIRIWNIRRLERKLNVSLIPMNTFKSSTV